MRHTNLSKSCAINYILNFTKKRIKWTFDHMSELLRREFAMMVLKGVSPLLLSLIFGKLCHQNTQFSMYTITSKQQEGFSCKDSYPKCFITTNFDKFHREGAINRDAILKACYRHFPLCFHFNLYTSIKLM